MELPGRIQAKQQFYKDEDINSSVSRMGVSKEFLNFLVGYLLRSILTDGVASFYLC
jgi:hypothetical protein